MRHALPQVQLAIASVPCILTCTFKVSNVCCANMVGTRDSVLELCHVCLALTFTSTKQVMKTYHTRHALPQVQHATDIEPAFFHALSRFSTCAAQIWCAHDTASLQSFTLPSNCTFRHLAGNSHLSHEACIDTSSTRY